MIMQRVRQIILASIILVLITVLLTTNAGTASLASDGTPRPSPTPSTTPVPALELPAWITDPSQNVYITFAYADYNDSPLPTFVSADTGERFALELPYVDDVTWFTLNNDLFLRLARYRSSGADNSDGFVEIVDSNSGHLTRYSLDDPARPDKAEPSPESSPLANYEISDDPEIILTVGSTTLTLENPFIDQGYRYVDATWYGEFLHVYFWDYADFFQRRGEDVIYDSNGEIVRTFEDAANLRWANQRESLVFLRDDSGVCLYHLDTADLDCQFLAAWESENHSRVTNYSWLSDDSEIFFFSSNGPQGGICRYILESGDINCLWERTLAYEPFSGGVRYQIDDDLLVFSYSNRLDDIWDTRSPRDTGLCVAHLDADDVYCPTDDLLPEGTYLWTNRLSPDRDKLAFVYTSFSDGDGLCIHDFASRETVCPVAQDDVFRYFIDAYDWSPDGRHIVIVTTPAGHLSDDKSLAQFGFVNIESGTYRHEGYAMYEHSPGEYWRP